MQCNNLHSCPNLLKKKGIGFYKVMPIILQLKPNMCLKEVRETYPIIFWGK